ncbi:glycosyltransferase [Hydrogenophaga sp.]|jgi:colanic acid/amylovoran biosynthesis glycosyltransferase|uniref:glycosyltransferase n=1 Tax=Hydrogenophaga sp. TaxID=1904254 RepID=UPI003F6FDD5C
MKVAYLTSQYPATSHTFIRREVEALRGAGIDIATFSIRPPSDSERCDPENVSAFETTTYILPPRLPVLLGSHLRCVLKHPLRYLRTLRDAFRHRVPGLSSGIYSFIYFSEAMILADALRKQQIEHLHNHFANASATVGYLATRYLDIDFSLTLHGISEFDYPSGLLLKEKLEHARFVACVSHFGRAQAMRITSQEEWSKMEIVRCGIDPSRFSPAPQVSGKGRLRLLHVGRLAAEKGQAGLISAFAQMQQQGIDAELRIVGDGPLEAELRHQANALGLGDRCVFLGRHGEDGVLDELRKADAFVIASLMEGLPVVLMEAMACRVPVIAPHIAGIPELVAHDETGLLFTPGDWNDLNKQLFLLLSDEARRTRLAGAGQLRTLKQFRIETAVQPLIACFFAEKLETYPSRPLNSTARKNLLLDKHLEVFTLQRRQTQQEVGKSSSSGQDRRFLPEKDDLHPCK